MADAEFSHLPQEVRPIAALDAAARIAHIRVARWVQHAAADRVLGYLHEALAQPPRERMENILLVGESGMGKTMLIRKFERQTIAAFDDAGGVQRRPVVVMLMPHQPTEAQFFGQLLGALHAPVAGHFIRGFPLQDPAVRLLHELGTRVVVIDETQLSAGGHAASAACLSAIAAFPVQRAAAGVRRCGRTGSTPCPAFRQSAAEPLHRYRTVTMVPGRGSSGLCGTADLEFAVAPTFAGGLAQASTPPGGADRRYHARNLQGVRAGGDRRDPRGTGEDRSEQLRGSRDLARRCHTEPDRAGAAARYDGSTTGVMPAPLPLAPRPYAGEAISSWVKRVAARYDIAAHHLVSHLLDGYQVSVGRAERLDHRADATLEMALGKATRFDLARIESLRIAGDDGSASCWHRMCPAWCPVCIRGDLAHLGEVYERAIWRLGCCVLCPRHGVPLDDTCRHCAAEAPCHFRGVNGLLRLACNTCGRQVDPTLCRNGGLDDEGARVLGVRLTPSLTQRIGTLQSDALAAFGGSVPQRSWGLMPSASHLIDAIRELAVCIIVATGTKFIPRIELPEPQAGQAISLIYEPITLASLPVYAARGVLGIVAAMLANLEPGSRSRHRGDPIRPPRS